MFMNFYNNILGNHGKFKNEEGKKKLKNLLFCQTCHCGIFASAKLIKIRNEHKSLQELVRMPNYMRSISCDKEKIVTLTPRDDRQIKHQ